MLEVQVNGVELKAFCTSKNLRYNLKIIKVCVYSAYILQSQVHKNRFSIKFFVKI